MIVPRALLTKSTMADIVCSNCRRPHENENQGNCTVCQRDFCNECITKCDICDRLLCKNHAETCFECSKQLCPRDECNCNICNLVYCSAHAKMCEDCRRYFCCDHQSQTFSCDWCVHNYCTGCSDCNIDNRSGEGYCDKCWLRIMRTCFFCEEWFCIKSEGVALTMYEINNKGQKKKNESMYYCSNCTIHDERGTRAFRRSNREL